MELPKEKIKSTRVNPKSIIIFGHPKIGKTTAISALDKCLVIDVEGGSDFVDAMKIDVLKEAEKANELPIITLIKLIKQIKKANEENKGFLYKYIALDTVSSLEDIIIPYANKLYKATPVGRNWLGDDVTLLPNGAGWRFHREAMLSIINDLSEICDTLIILGHTKDKDIELNGEAITEKSLDLMGKMSSMLPSKVDAVGYMYREENETIINFVPSQSLVCGGRSEHLKNKKITVITSDQEGNLTIDWSKIFINK